MSRVVQQGAEACAQVSVKFEGKYLPVFINFRLNFQYEAEESHLGGAGGGDYGAGGGSGGDYGDDEEEDEKEWPLDAYTMVFGQGRPFTSTHTFSFKQCINIWMCNSS